MVRTLGLKGDVGDVGKSLANEEGVNVDKLRGRSWARTADTTVSTTLYSRIGIAEILMRSLVHRTQEKTYFATNTKQYSA